MSLNTPFRLLVLGASYGLLPGVKLALAGHRVTIVGRADEVAAMAKAPLRVDLPLRRSEERIVLETADCAFATPADAWPEQADMVILAMQEPQFAAPDVAALIARIAASQVPCLSLMNLPPPPFLARLGTVPDRALDGVFTAREAWAALDPALVTLASPDAQALRLDPSRPGELTVTLASNFKAAPFADPAAQAVLETVARDMSHLKQAGQRVPVALVTSPSLHVPLAKWPMLLTGNCRCVTAGDPLTIAQAVHGDLSASAALYDQVAALVRKLGASDADIVPFTAYTHAALGLTRPSSLARALASGAAAVERIDRLVLNLQRIHVADDSSLAAISDLIDRKLAANRK